MIRFSSPKILPEPGRGTAPNLFQGGVVEGPLGQVVAYRGVAKPTPQTPCPTPSPSTTATRGPPSRTGEDMLHTELFASADDASGAALALAFAHQPDDHRPWLWVQDKTAIRQSGRPYRPGLPPSLRHRLIHVAADTWPSSSAKSRAIRRRSISPRRAGSASYRRAMACRYGWCGWQHGMTWARHACAGMSPPRPVRRRNGTRKAPAIRAGRPTCSARTSFNPVNGC